MEKYNVAFPYIVWVNVKVEAENEEDAIDHACDEVYLESYVGNGGSDKLIGVCGENLSIENPDDFCELPDADIKIQVEKFVNDDED